MEEKNEHELCHCPGGGRIWTILSWRGLGSVSGLVGASRADHIVVSLPAAGVLIVIIWTFVQKGTKRFREKWNQEHGMRTGLQQNMEKQELLPN